MRQFLRPLVIFIIPDQNYAPVKMSLYTVTLHDLKEADPDRNITMQLLQDIIHK